jgi:M6 family metalloprotease-like protein
MWIQNELRRKAFKTLLLIFLMGMVFSAVGAFAAPFQDEPQTMVQPDGSEVSYYATGDEYFRYLHDAQGNVLMIDPDTGYLTYAAVGGSALVPTAEVYGQSFTAVTITAEQIPKAYIEDTVKSAQKLLQSSVRPRTRAASTPLSLGKLNNLVMFVAFSDIGFTYSLEDYETMYNGEVPSVRSFFDIVSYGQLDVRAHFVGQTSGAVVPYVDAHPKSYYAPKSATNPDGYANGPAGDVRKVELLNRVLAHYKSALETCGLEYDKNNDRVVDCVTFIHAGENDTAQLGFYKSYHPLSGTNTIKLPNGNGNATQIDYIMASDVPHWTAPGPHRHEIFHILGAPDLYQFNTMTNYFLPAAGFDMMEHSHGHMLAHMRERFGHWLEIPTITESGTYTLDPIALSKNGALRILSPYSSTGPSGETFVVEYRKRDLLGDKFYTGDNAKFPLDGLVVYRVKNQENLNNGNSYVNSLDKLYLYVFRPEVTATDLRGDNAKATLSAESGRTEMGAYTDPAIVLSDGSFAGITISEVGYAGDTITFHVEIDDPNKPRPPIGPAEPGVPVLVPSYEDAETIYIDLSAETMTLPDGFAIAAYSVNGGTKWKTGTPNLPKLLDRELRLVVTNQYDRRAKRPAPDAVTYSFPGIRARPKANAERLAPYYPAETDDRWVLAKKSDASGAAVYAGYEWAATSNNKTPDGAWTPVSADGFALLAGKTKQRFLVRTVPAAAYGMYTPSSKVFKVTPKNLGKAPNSKIDYKKEILKLKRGDAYAVGDGGFVLVTSNTELDVAELITDGTAIHVKKAATGKKPATEIQTFTPQPRAALEALTLTCADGKITTNLKAYEVYDAAKNKWGKLPKVTASGTYQIRLKSTAKAQSNIWSGSAASAAETLTVTFGVYNETKNKRGITAAVIEVQEADAPPDINPAVSQPA